MRTLYCNASLKGCTKPNERAKQLKAILPFRILFFGVVFLSSCNSTTSYHSKQTASDQINNLVKEDRVWMEQFFQDFFLSGPPIYTLFGSKPISAATLNYASEDESRISALLYADRENMQGEEREWFLRAAAEQCKADKSAENWQKWVRFFQAFPKSPFLFAKRATLSKYVWSGYIVNVQETVWTLQKHYNLFKQALDRDFDPVAVTMDFTNPHSDFWNAVFSSHLLSGIVLGFGYKNAYFFDMMMKRQTASKQADPIFSAIPVEPSRNIFDDSIANLPLPHFRSFGLPFNEDLVVEKYKRERRRIQSHLNSDNFFEAIFLQLMGVNSQQDDK